MKITKKVKMFIALSALAVGIPAAGMAYGATPGMVNITSSTPRAQIMSNQSSYSKTPGNQQIQMPIAGQGTKTMPLGSMQSHTDNTPVNMPVSYHHNNMYNNAQAGMAAGASGMMAGGSNGHAGHSHNMMGMR